MHADIHTCTLTHKYTYTHAQTCIHTKYACTCTQTRTQTQTHRHRHTQTHRHTDTHTQTQTHTHTHMHTHACTYTDTHTDTHTNTVHTLIYIIHAVYAHTTATYHTQVDCHSMLHSTGNKHYWVQPSCIHDDRWTTSSHRPSYCQPSSHCLQVEW